MSRRVSVNKSELVKAIAKKAEVTNANAQAILEAFVDAVKDGLKKGDKIQLIGFGSFATVKREARKGVNPQTKKAIKIPAKKVAKFMPGKELKELVNGVVAKKKK
ncbi:MAG: HU family DNA-binding protein [Candidatus Riflebacteria bacterium]